MAPNLSNSNCFIYWFLSSSSSLLFFLLLGSHPCVSFWFVSIVMMFTLEKSVDDKNSEKIQIKSKFSFGTSCSIFL